MARHVGYSSLHQHFRTAYISITGIRPTVMEEREIKDYFSRTERTWKGLRERLLLLEWGTPFCFTTCGLRVFTLLLLIGFEYVGRGAAWIFQGVVNIDGEDVDLLRWASHVHASGAVAVFLLLISRLSFLNIRVSQLVREILKKPKKSARYEL